jgi:flagellar biosynthesis chaperone FliJ
VKSFEFPLHRVLDWRKTQLDLAEAAFRRQAEALAAVERMAAALQAGARSATSAAKASRPLVGAALGSLDSYNRFVHLKEKELERRRAECAERAAEAERAMLEARRRTRLLEKLKEKRLGEWQAAGSRELEELASDSYLAQWNRRRA